MRKSVLICGLFFLSFGTVKPISEQDVKIVSSIGGVVSGITVGGVTYLGTNKLGDMSLAPSIIFSSASAVGSGALTYYLIYKSLLKHTPRGRYLRAKMIVRAVEADSLISREFKDLKALKNHIIFRFKTNWPLVKCRNYLEVLANNLNEASKILLKASNRAGKNSKLKSLHEECEKLQEEIQNTLEAIEDKIGLIFDDEDYRNQLELYERHMQLEYERVEREKDRALVRQMHAEDIKQEKHDRRLELASKLADARQREEDRKLKKKFLKKDDVGVNLNI